MILMKGVRYKGVWREKIRGEKDSRIGEWLLIISTLEPDYLELFQFCASTFSSRKGCSNSIALLGCGENKLL